MKNIKSLEGSTYVSRALKSIITNLPYIDCWRHWFINTEESKVSLLTTPHDWPRPHPWTSSQETPTPTIVAGLLKQSLRKEKRQDSVWLTTTNTWSFHFPPASFYKDAILIISTCSNGNTSGFPFHELSQCNFFSSQIWSQSCSYGASSSLSEHLDRPINQISLCGRRHPADECAHDMIMLFTKVYLFLKLTLSSVHVLHRTIKQLWSKSMAGCMRVCVCVCCTATSWKSKNCKVIRKYGGLVPFHKIIQKHISAYISCAQFCPFITEILEVLWTCKVRIMRLKLLKIKTMKW